MESVLAQNLTRFEHIVVDDGSTDGTAAALAAIRDPRLIYVGAKWRGANAARNAGIERARAPVVTFLDSDDVYLAGPAGTDAGAVRGQSGARSPDQLLRVPEGRPQHQLRQPRRIPEPGHAGEGTGRADDLHRRIRDNRPPRGLAGHRRLRQRHRADAGSGIAAAPRPPHRRATVRGRRLEEVQFGEFDFAAARRLCRSLCEPDAASTRILPAPIPTFRPT